jgi:hypothetical protein
MLQRYVAEKSGKATRRLLASFGENIWVQNQGGLEDIATKDFILRPVISIAAELGAIDVKPPRTLLGYTTADKQRWWLANSQQNQGLDGLPFKTQDLG